MYATRSRTAPKPRHRDSDKAAVNAGLWRERSAAVALMGGVGCNNPPYAADLSVNVFVFLGRHLPSLSEWQAELDRLGTRVRLDEGHRPEYPLRILASIH